MKKNISVLIYIICRFKKNNFIMNIVKWYDFVIVIIVDCKYSSEVEWIERDFGWDCA